MDQDARRPGAPGILTPDPGNGVCRPGAGSILVGVAVHPARRRQLLPPSPQGQARRAEETAAWRAEHDRRGGELRPARLAAVCTGPAVRDPYAAADCRCSCHPKPADAELHDGGLSCGQLTAEEVSSLLCSIAVIQQVQYWHE